MTRRRRENGEGSAYRMADGRWRAEVTVGWKTDATGKRTRIRKYVYAASEREAKVERNALLRRLGNGELSAGGRDTVKAWLDHWTEVVCVERGLTPSTLNGYRNHAKKWIVPVVGSIRLDELQVEDVERVYRLMREAGNAPSHVLGCHRTLRRALRVAQQRRKITVNPCDLLDAPGVPETEAEHFSKAEARKLLQAAQGRRNGARWSVALAIGIRQSEALGLLREKIDLDAGTIRVDRQLRRSYNGSGVTLARPKSRRSNRTVAIPPPLVPILREHLERLDQERESIGKGWRGCGLVDVDGKPVRSQLVFARMDGRHVDHSDDWEEWGQVVAAAGLRRIPLHGARHTAATLLLAQGVHPRVAQEILGHSSATLFMTTYAHVVDDMQRDAAERLGAALWDETG